MKLSYKIFFLSLFLFFQCAYAIKSNHGLDGFIVNRIDAQKNARVHSNMGNIYFDEKNYISALKEYEIAYALTRNLRSSSVYLYNIARCHMVLGNYVLSKELILSAINKDCMNLTYYQALCDCIVKLNQEKEEINNYLQKTNNPYNRIIVGLLYLKSGNKNIARQVFDEFINNNPDMLITNDIKILLKKM